MIRFVRSILCAFCFFIFGLGCLFVGSAIFPVMLLFYKSNSQRKLFANTVHITWRAFVWLMCILGLIRINCKKRPELKALNGTIVVANHPSLIDVVILVSLIPNSICVVKNSLFKNFFIRKVISKVYLSNTMNPDEFIQCGSDILQKGYNIIIFPEGTRTIYNNPVRLHRGVAYLQIATGAKILPIKILNEPKILGKLQKWWDVDRKTSVYDIIPQAYIFAPDKTFANKRNTAINIMETVKKAIF